MKELSDKEIISMLLYLCEDLKMKIFHGEKFGLYQLPTINSIMACAKEQTKTEGMSNEEFTQIVIHAAEKKLTWNK